MPPSIPPDQKLEASLAKLDSVMKQGTEIKSRVGQLCQSVTALGEAFYAVSADACRFYSGWNHEPKYVLEKFSQTQMEFAVEVPKKVLPVLERDAGAVCDAWLKRINGSRARLEGLPPLYKTLDHYTKKVDGMNKDKAKAIKNASKWKEEERLMRNVGKLETARAEYEAARDVLVDEFDKEVRLSKIDFSKILGMVAHFQRRWTVELAQATVPNDQAVQGLQELLKSPEINQD